MHRCSSNPTLPFSGTVYGIKWLFIHHFHGCSCTTAFTQWPHIMCDDVESQMALIQKALCRAIFFMYTLKSKLFTSNCAFVRLLGLSKLQIYKIIYAWPEKEEVIACSIKWPDRHLQCPCVVFGLFFGFVVLFDFLFVCLLACFLFWSLLLFCFGVFVCFVLCCF